VKSRSRAPRSIETWQREWQGHWSKAGAQPYELPAGSAAGSERAFLAETRSPQKELARLKRINDEFVRGFRGLYQVGPAVTVFGSARFKESHRYYKLARAVGAELARAGFATLTGGPTAAHTKPAASAMDSTSFCLTNRTPIPTSIRASSSTTSSRAR
jgi:hypothetical protein